VPGLPHLAWYCAVDVIENLLGVQPAR